MGFVGGGGGRMPLYQTETKSKRCTYNSYHILVSHTTEVHLNLIKRFGGKGYAF